MGRVISLGQHARHGPWTGHEQPLPDKSRRNPPGEAGRLMGGMTVRAALGPSAAPTGQAADAHTRGALTPSSSRPPDTCSSAASLSHVTCGSACTCSDGPRHTHHCPLKAPHAHCRATRSHTQESPSVTRLMTDQALDVSGLRA